MIFLRRTFPLMLAFVVGILGIGVYYVPHAASQSLEQELALWLRIVYAFSFFLGTLLLAFLLLIFAFWTTSIHIHWRRFALGAASIQSFWDLIVLFYAPVIIKYLVKDFYFVVVGYKIRLGSRAEVIFLSGVYVVEAFVEV